MIARKSIKKILVTMAIAFVVIAIVAYMVVTKPHRSVDNEEGVAVSAVQLFNEFRDNETEANKKYLDVTVEVTGEIAEISEDMDGKQVIALKTDDLMFGIRCTMTKDQEGSKPGDQVTIKGICKGFLSDVVVTDGIIKKQ